MFAKGTDYTVNTEETTEIGTGSLTVNYTLIDEAGDTLVDEDGNILISEEFETVYGEVLHSKNTDYTVHAED